MSNIFTNVNDNTEIPQKEVAAVLRAIRTQEAKAAQMRAKWIEDSVNEALCIGFGVGTYLEKWLVEAVGTIDFAAIVALEWNYTIHAPELKVMRRATDIGNAAIRNQTPIDREMARLIVLALAVSREKIFAKAPIASMNEAMRVLISFSQQVQEFKSQKAASL